ncbi:MAG: zinc-ribbon domain containing protein [Candidatus Eremiobacteraeota bacterium]|nr:zinc-ribbon domain containing protein [Candidatus Eremiobacteraeota bacterium]
MYTDETLTCTDCSTPFTFSAGEQAFYASKGFQNKPTRCPDCRAKRKTGGAVGPREMHSVTCTECGQQAEVPFMPRGDKPVYCRDCFAKVRSASQ